MMKSLSSQSSCVICRFKYLFSSRRILSLLSLLTIFISGFVHPSQATSDGLLDEQNSNLRGLTNDIDGMDPNMLIPSEQVNSNIPQDWLQTVQQDIQDSEYNITWQERSPLADLPPLYQAPNRAHNFRTYFTQRGIYIVPRVNANHETQVPDWRLGIRLVGYGWSDAIGRPGDPLNLTTLKNHLNYSYPSALVEQYVNSPEGLEQIFTISHAPEPAGMINQPSTNLLLEFLITGSLNANSNADTSAIEFTTQGGVRVLQYGNIIITDSNGRSLSRTIQMTPCLSERPGVECTYSLVINTKDAMFPLYIDPLITTIPWVAESNQYLSSFSSSVGTAGDINGDGYADVIVGAPNYDNGQSDEGRAFVYNGSESGLSSSPNWTAESDQPNAYFGSSLGTAGDINKDGFADVIIGAPNYDNGQTDEGKVFVYYGSSSGLNSSASWTAESDQVSAKLGISAGTAGDVNGDGYSDVIVGAYLFDNGQTDEGRAFVYYGSSSGLNSSASWTAESDQVSAKLGISAGTAGDVNGDGYSDVIVGAYLYDNGQTDEGRAFVYYGSSSGLNSSASWTAESDQASASYGYSVGTAGDVNGDGYSDVVVGAYLYDNGQTDEGQVFVYYGSSAGLSITANWTAQSGQAAANFGYSVGTAGDINGDQFADLVVGAYLYDNGQTDEGVVFAYYGSPSGLSSNANWTRESDQGNAKMGYSVGTAGDVNGDGYSDIIMGAPSYDNDQPDEGRSFVYFGSSAGLSSGSNWIVESNQDRAHFGFSVGTAGDVNGDGFADVIIGAPEYDNGQIDEGRAYLYHGSASGLSSTANWTAESDQGYAQFGYSVGTAGDVNGDSYSDVIVGAQGYDDGQTNEGRASVYHGSASGLSSTANWTAESDLANTNFGGSVGTAGDINGDGYSDIIIGAWCYDNGQVDEGRAYVFYGSISGLSLIADWTVESNQAYGNLGYSVGTAGDVNGDGFADVIVGTPGYSNGQTGEGQASVYHGSASGLSSTANWTAESNQGGARFGSSVGTAGDVNGDGFTDVIIGTPFYDNGQTDEGRAFVYHGSSSGLSSTANWTAESDQGNAQFGYSTGTSGDINGDGYADVIVGAHLYDNGQSEEGRGFVYYGSSSGLSMASNWIVESDQNDARFAYSVGAAGDVNGDGFGDLIVGARYYDNGQTDEGGAFVYYGSSSGLISIGSWTAESDQPYANFGSSLGTAGDINGDGYSDVAVGAYLFDNGQTDEGKVYVYLGSESGLSLTPSWTAEGNSERVYFGHSIGTTGDVNGDGYEDLIIGAYGYSNRQGRAYVYNGSSSGLAANPNWTADGSQTGAYFAYSVGTAGDVNGDGFSDVVVGAPNDQNGQQQEGRAFVYYGSSSGLAGSPNWTGEGNLANASYGISVATAGDVNRDGYSDVVVGAPAYTNGQEKEGKAFVYLGSSSGLNSSAAWTGESDQAGAVFGEVVGTAGDVNRDGYSEQLSGIGNIQANGGSSNYCGAGGGGRIGIYRVEKTDPISMTITANGGIGYNNGSIGSIYLDDIDSGFSSVEISPDTLPADGVTTSIITVTVKNTSNIPMPNKLVDLFLESGQSCNINGNPVSTNGSINIGNTNSSGVITATVSATVSGERKIRANSGQETISLTSESIVFIPGSVSASRSSILANPESAPADGLTAIPVIVTIRDANDNLIPDVPVTLSVSSNTATIITPTITTNINGEARFSVVDTEEEIVTITATADNNPLQQAITITFRLVDLAVNQAGLSYTSKGWSNSHATSGYPITYTITVDNLGLFSAQDVRITDTFPSELQFQSWTGIYTPIVNGNTIVWNVGTLDEGAEVKLAFTAAIPNDFQGSITNTVVVTSSIVETPANSENNHSSLRTVVELPAPFIKVDPDSIQMNAIQGQTNRQSIQISNPGTAELTNISVTSPINLDWVDLEGVPETLQPGQNANITIAVTPPITASGNYQVPLTITGGGKTAYAAITLRLVSNNVRNLQFSLTSTVTQPITYTGYILLTSIDPEQIHLASGETITYYPQYRQPIGTDGTVIFENMEIGTYGYYTKAKGFLPKTGSVDLIPKSESQSQGYRFVEMELLAHSGLVESAAASVNQPRVAGTAGNEDTLNYPIDLGGNDDYYDYVWEVIPVGPSYEIKLHLTYQYTETIPLPGWSCEDDQDGVVCIPADLGFDYPGFTLPPSFITQTVQAQVDISQQAIMEGQDFLTRFHFQNTGFEPMENVSAEVYALETNGEEANIAFEIIKIDDIASTISPGGIEYGEWALIPQITVTDTNGIRFLAGIKFHFEMNGVQHQILIPTQEIIVYPAPDIHIAYEMPSPNHDCLVFDLKATIENRGLGGARNFSISVPDIVVEGSPDLSFSVISTTVGGTPVNGSITIPYFPPSEKTDVIWRIQATRPGRFTSFTVEYQEIDYMDLPLTPTMSPPEARLVDRSCVITAVPEDWPWSFCPDNCFNKNSGPSQGSEAGPISTRTGGYDYSFTDISISTLAGPLEYQRWYSTKGSSFYTQTLGYGWTHSLDIRLILPYQPGGENGFILFKANSANLYRFALQPDGSYVPPLGTCGSLIKVGTNYQISNQSNWVYDFDSTGKLIRLTAPNGGYLVYMYSENRLERVSDETGQRYLAIGYDTSGRVTTVSDHTNRSVSFNYNTEGNLIQARDVLSNTWTYHYSDTVHSHFLTAIIDPGGMSVERTIYDELGRATEQYNGNGDLVVELIYHDDGTTQIIDGNGITETHRYDDRNTLVSQDPIVGNSTSKTYGNNLQPLSISTSPTQTTYLNWSPDGLNLTEVKDAAGYTTTMGYDSLNNLTAITDTLGNLTTYVYSGTLLIRSTDALSNTTVYTYTTSADAPQPPGLLKAHEDPLGHVVRYSYDPYGQRISMTDAQNRTTTYEYDNLGQLYITTDFEGKQYWTCYDAAGRVVRTAGHVTSGSPCASGYPQTLTTSLTQVNDTAYDLSGNAIASISWYYDQGAVISQTTRTYYDRANRPVTMVQNLSSNWGIDNETPPEPSYLDPLHNLRSDTVYDQAGNTKANIQWLLEGTETLTRTTRTYYDELNRPTNVVQNFIGDLNSTTVPAFDPAYPDQNVRSETRYDANGNIIETVDNAGRVTHSCYDNLNRVVKTVQNPTVSDPCIEYTPSSQPDRDIIQRTIYDPVGNTIASIDPPGRITRTYYDALNRPEYVVQNLTNWTIENTNPPLTNLRSNVENLTTQTIFDDAGNVIASIDPMGKITRTYYDALNRPYLIVDNLNPSWGIERSDPPTCNRDETGLLTPTNICAETIYDEEGRAIASVDPLGHISRGYFDELGRTKGVVRNFAGDVYSTTVPIYSATFPNQNVRTDTLYDGRGQTIATIAYFVENGVVISSTTRTYYDVLGRAIATVRNLTGSPYATGWPSYNPAYPDQDVRTEYIYDGTGAQVATVQVLAENNKVTTRAYYDRLGRTNSVVQNLTGQDAGNPNPPIPNTRESNLRIDTIYDATGSAIAQVEWLVESGNIITRTTRTYYDLLGRSIAVVQNLTGQTIDITDAPDRNPAAPDQNVRTDSGYDKGGNRTTTADPNGIWTSFEYDDLGRLAAVTENYRPGLSVTADRNVRTEYTYDVQGNRLTMRDGNATRNNTPDVTSFTYDLLGRLASQSDTLSHTTQYRYDVIGNQAAVIDANGFTTSYQYDDLYRLVHIDYPESDPDVDYDYNALGWHTEMADAVGNTRWSYDRLGRAIAITDPYTGTVSYTYDALGNRLSLTYPDNKLVQYEYDSLGRMTRVTGWDSQVISYTYDTNGNLLEVFRPGGLNSSYSYDGVGRVAEIAHTRNGALLSSFHYTYDPAGNRVQMEEVIRQESDPQAPLPPTNAQPVGQGFASVALSWQDNAVNEAGYYIYRSTDNQNWQRVASLDPDQSGYIDQGLVRYTQYWYRVSTYNSAGESQPVTTTAQTGFQQAEPVEEPVGTITPNVGISTTTAISYTYDSLSRLAGADYSSGIFYHYSYDSVGNRLSEEKLTVTTNYSYDIANRMAQAGSITYTWDANGNLLSDGANTYTYDHANRLKAVSGQSLIVSYKYNGLGDRTEQTVNNTTTRYTLDLNIGLTQVQSDGTDTYLYGVGRVAQQHGSQKEYFLTDAERTEHASGSVCQLADNTSVTLNKSYQPYGELLSGEGSSSSSYGYTGEVTDSYIELVYLRSRYYVPTTGRFHTKDTWQGDER